MKNIFTWKKGLFARTYEIFSGLTRIGSLHDNPFSLSSEGEINGRVYTYRTVGFFNQKTEIKDNLEGRIIGEIEFGRWMTSATLTIRNIPVNWKYDNWKNTSWRIYNPGGDLINYKGSTTKGVIESYTVDDLLLLSGLFVSNYFKQTTVAIMVAVFLPILVTLST